MPEHPEVGEIGYLGELERRDDLTERGEWRLKALRDVAERLPAALEQEDSDA